MERRQSEVDSIRERVRRLKALIEKRKASKERIVELQFKVQVNEVAGLGFSVRQSRRAGGMSPYGPGMDEMLMMGDSGAGQSRSMLGGVAGGFGGTEPAVPDPREKAERVLGAAIAKLRSASSQGDRQAATKELLPALEGYFVADLKVRERELKAIRKRVDRLDTLIERRRKARKEILSLQLEVLTNEAEGLGFFSTSVGRQADPYSGEGYGTYDGNFDSGH